MRRFSDLLKSIASQVSAASIVVVFTVPNPNVWGEDALAPVVQSNSAPAAVVTPVELKEDADSKVLPQAMVVRRKARSTRPADVRPPVAPVPVVETLPPVVPAAFPGVETLTSQPPEVGNVPAIGPVNAANESKTNEPTPAQPTSTGAVDAPGSLESSPTLDAPALAPPSAPPVSLDDQRQAELRLQGMISALGLGRARPLPQVANEPVNAPRAATLEMPSLENTEPSTQPALPPAPQFVPHVNRLALTTRTIGFRLAPQPRTPAVASSAAQFETPLPNAPAQPSFAEPPRALDLAVRNSDYRHPELISGSQSVRTHQAIQYSKPIGPPVAEPIATAEAQAEAESASLKSPSDRVFVKPLGINEATAGVPQLMISEESPEMLAKRQARLAAQTPPAPIAEPLPPAQQQPQPQPQREPVAVVEAKSPPPMQPLRQPRNEVIQPVAAPQPAPAFQVAARQPEAVPVPPAAEPFKVIEEVGEIRVTVRRSKLIQLTTNIYRTAIVDPSICDIVQYTPNEFSLIGRGVGSTHITFWFEGGQKPHTYLVTVDADEKVREQIEYEYQKLEDIVAELFPDSKVRLQVMADKLIVRGQARDSEDAARILAMVRGQGNNGNWGNNGIGVGLAGGQAARVLSDREAGNTNGQQQALQVINMLRVPGIQQVALRVKIAELNRSAARGFGIDIAGNVNFTDNPRGSQMFIRSVLNMAVGAGGAQPILAQFDGDDIQLGFRYLESHGLIRLISEPTLVTMSGTRATFVAGGEFAVPTVVGSAGLNAVTTDFRSFGAVISFLPTVIDKDHIRLQIAPEFSQVNNALAVGGTPGLTTRAVSTTVEMREGQTFAIAGLLEDNLRTSTQGNIPFLAKLLGKRDSAHNETELLILVTPDLVHPMEAEEVPPLPGFDVTEPDNWQFFIRGDIEGNPTRDFRYTVWPRLRQRYNSGGTSMISGPFGHAQ